MSAETTKTGPLSPNEAASKISANVLNPKAKPDNQGDGGKKAKADQSKPKQKQKATPSKEPEKKAKIEKGAEDDPFTAGLQDGQSEDDEPEADEDDASANPDDADDQSDEDQDHEGEDGDNDEDDGESEETHTVKVNGEEMEVSLSELKDGYQRQADYTKKLQDLANDRKLLDREKDQVKELPKVQKAHQDAAERFSRNAGLVLQALEQKFMPPLPSEALKVSNPAEYIRMKEAHQEGLQFMAALGGEVKKIEGSALTNLQAEVRKGREKLFEMQPELKDAKNRQKLREYAKAHGFTDQQIQMEPSPILFEWAYKAQKYDEIMTRKEKLVSDKPKPKVLKNSKAATDHKAVKDRDRAKKLEAHKAAGSVHSAADAISGLLKKTASK